MEFTRRQLLSATVGAAGTGILAGCTGSEADSSEPESTAVSAQATFFVFGDIASQVAGEAATADLLVPIGQHGHGWEPGPSVRTDIREADLLVHGMDGFQPWVDDITGDLEADGADVSTIDVTAEVDLLSAGGGHDDGHEGEHTAHHDEETHHGEATADVDHDHDSDADPHFWMDPLRVKDAVGTVRDGFADSDPDSGGAYQTNAAAFRSDLDDLHQRLESTVAEATTHVVLVAGHNSVRYLGERYDIEVVALTGLSPDDRPTAQDIDHAQAVIETHDLQYICADPLESQQAAEQLVADTDAEAVLPLTAMPGLTDEWDTQNWGYVDVMEQVNVPTLERALGAQ
ncbi:adhesin [Haloarcula mannanilytica]|uniref:Adhesin n=1 Tax=Haloarcula mannanilytica TaxID=2509225 RepID=A0A4C2EJ56_9EURY|nr:metal ABC transporter substrate-binding protein [Haloarcula mannanilytica]GCF14528.1 adhesin [Haloarcula mannanilytica]